MTEPKMKPCPECDGFGEHTWNVDYVDRGGLGGLSPVQRTERCERCDGTGEIEDEETGEDE